MAGASGESDGFEQFLGAAAAFADAGPGDAQGEFDVLVGGEQGQQAEGLEDEADAMAAELGELAFVVLGDVLAVDRDVAGGGGVEAGDQVEQGGLAGAGAADQGDELAAGDLERDVADGPDIFAADHEFARDAVDIDDQVLLAVGGHAVGCQWGGHGRSASSSPASASWAGVITMRPSREST